MPNEENEEPTPTGFGERVLAAMDQADAGWNLRPFAERIKVTYSNFWRWLYKTARGPDIDVYVRICSVLHCSLADLMDPETRKEYTKLNETALLATESEPDNLAAALAAHRRTLAVMERLVGKGD